MWCKPRTLQARSSGQLVVGAANLPWCLVISSKITPSCERNFSGELHRCKLIGGHEFGANHLVRICAPLYVSVQALSYWFPYLLPAWCDPQTMQPWHLLEVAQVVVFVAASNLRLRSALTKPPPRQLRQPSVYGCQWQLQLSKFWFWQPINSSGGFVWSWSGMIVEHPMPCMGIQNIVVWEFRVSFHVGCSLTRF
jgi:hypothetical protein